MIPAKKPIGAIWRCITGLKLKKRNRSQKKRVRVKSYDYKHMYDSVHPDSHLKSLWRDKILRGVRAALCASLQESSQEEDWGDFKRKRHFWVQVSTHVPFTTGPVDKAITGVVDKQTFMLLYRSMVTPYLEVSNSVWVPHQKQDDRDHGTGTEKGNEIYPRRQRSTVWAVL